MSGTRQHFHPTLHTLVSIYLYFNRWNWAFLRVAFPNTSLRECQINITLLTYSTMEQEVARSWKQASSPGKGYIIPWSSLQYWAKYFRTYEPNRNYFLQQWKNEKSLYFNHIKRTSCVMFSLASLRIAEYLGVFALVLTGAKYIGIHSKSYYICLPCKVHSTLLKKQALGIWILTLLDQHVPRAVS